MSKKQIKNSNPRTAKKNSFQNSASLHPLPPVKWQLFFIAILSVLLFGNSIMNEYALDDKTVITENSFTRQGFKGIPDILKSTYWFGYHGTQVNIYRPLPLITHALEYQFFGPNPHISHLINVLLFSLTGLAIYLAILYFFNFKNYLVPFITAILFVSHPIHTEVVAGIKGRDDLLCMLFLMLTLLYLFRYIISKKKYYWLFSGIFFLLAFFSKESSITFLAIIPLSVHFFTEEKPKSVIVLSLPYFLVFGIYLLIRNLVIETSEVERFFDSYFQYAPSRADRIATGVSNIGLYMRLLVFPHPLIYDYSYNTIKLISWENAKALISVLVIAGLMIYSLFSIKSRKTAGYAILFFFISLSVSSNLIITTPAIFAERFIYVSSLGFCLWAAILLPKLFKIPENSYTDWKLIIQRQKIFTGTIIFVLLGYSAKTISRNFDWKNDETLFSNDIKLAPDNARMHYNLGRFYAIQYEKDKDSNKAERAAKELKKTLRIDGQFYDAVKFLTPVLANTGNYQDGIFYLEPFTKTPVFMALPHADQEKLWLDLGNFYFNNKQYEKAIEQYGKGLVLNNQASSCYFNIGASYYNLGRYEEALQYFLTTVKINPEFPGVSKNIEMCHELLNGKKNVLSLR